MPVGPDRQSSAPARRSARAARFARPLRTATGGSPRPSSVTTTHTSLSMTTDTVLRRALRMPDDVRQQLTDHGHEVEHEVGRQVVALAAYPQVRRRSWPSVTDRTTSVSRRGSAAIDESSASCSSKIDVRMRAIVPCSSSTLRDRRAAASACSVPSDRPSRSRDRAVAKIRWTMWSCRSRAMRSRSAWTCSASRAAAPARAPGPPRPARRSRTAVRGPPRRRAPARPPASRPAGSGRGRRPAVR